MTAQKPAGAKKGGGIMGALMDLLILVLLIGAAGGGGYFWGLNQRLAPVQPVGSGTPGAQPAPAASTTSATTTAATSPTPAAAISPTPAATTSPTTSPTPAATTSPTPATTSTPAPAPAAISSTKKPGKLKYWLCSQGVEYTGYSITVSVNGVQVDNFFGPGKSVDVTRHVKDGENNVEFSAKVLPREYNKHKGDSKSVLTVKLVSGPSIQEDFKSEDVVLEYERNAAESDSSEDTMHFVKS